MRSLCSGVVHLQVAVIHIQESCSGRHEMRFFFNIIPECQRSFAKGLPCKEEGSDRGNFPLSNSFLRMMLLKLFLTEHVVLLSVSFLLS